MIRSAIRLGIGIALWLGIPLGLGAKTYTFHFPPEVHKEACDKNLDLQKKGLNVKAERHMKQYFARYMPTFSNQYSRGNDKARKSQSPRTYRLTITGGWTPQGDHKYEFYGQFSTGTINRYGYPEYITVRIKDVIIPEQMREKWEDDMYDYSKSSRELVFSEITVAEKEPVSSWISFCNGDADSDRMELHTGTELTLVRYNLQRAAIKTTSDNKPKSTGANSGTAPEVTRNGEDADMVSARPTSTRENFPGTWLADANGAMEKSSKAKVVPRLQKRSGTPQAGEDFVSALLAPEENPDNLRRLIKPETDINQDLEKVELEPETRKRLEDCRLYVHRKTPITAAICLNRPRSVKILLDAGANFAKSYMYYGPGAPLEIDAAVAINSTEIVRLLLNAGLAADTSGDCEDGCGPLPLTQAVMHGNIEMVKLLLTHKWDPNLVRSGNGTCEPIVEALGDGHEKLFALLKASGGTYVQCGPEEKEFVELAFRSNVFKTEHFQITYEPRARKRYDAIGGTDLFEGTLRFVALKPGEYRFLFDESLLQKYPKWQRLRDEKRIQVVPKAVGESFSLDFIVASGKPGKIKVSFAAENGPKGQDIPIEILQAQSDE